MATIVDRSWGYLGRTFDSLRIRDFRYLTASSLGMGFGQWFQQIGLGLLVYDLTGSATQLGLITAVRGGMLLLAALAGGILSDRLSRRTVIIASTGVGAVQAAVLVALIVWGVAQVWHLYIFALVEGLATGINQPARFAFVRDITTQESLPNAVALNSLAMNASRVVGPPLAGVIYGLLGAAWLFIGLALLKMIAMGLTMLISRQTRQVFAEAGEAPLRTLWGGIRYAFKDRTILALLVVAAIPSLLVYPYVQMLPFFAYEVLGSGPQGYGVLASGMGYGSIIGLVVLAFMGDIPRKGLVMFASLLAYCVFVVAFTQSEVFGLSMALLIIGGTFHGPSITLTQTLLLLRSRQEMTGRVMSLNGMTQGLQPLGAIPMGIAIDAWGPANAVAAFVVAAAVTVAVTAALAGSLRRT